MPAHCTGPGQSECRPESVRARARRLKLLGLFRYVRPIPQLDFAVPAEHSWTTESRVPFKLDSRTLFVSPAHRSCSRSTTNLCFDSIARPTISNRKGHQNTGPPPSNEALLNPFRVCRRHHSRRSVPSFVLF